MSNVHEIQLTVIPIPRQYAEEVFECLVNTVVFHRALGEVTFKEKTLPQLDIDYVICDHLEVQKQVRIGVEKFLSESKPFGDFVMEIVFFEDRLKNGWLSTYTAPVEWEKWRIPFHISRRPIDAETRDKVRKEVQGRIEEVVKEASERMDLVPPVKKIENPMPFKFEVKLPTSGNAFWGLVNK
eukprot:CAMPEP_0201476758 /NCGR_PEP_ID=MMETSP0151_2-20130828/1899_1 /ASSEMBLY_ACC=CAM_ASM_000257 /TAXON_ID=200890 /ORGANISM="Paramoeba atlantica, Strain 621/1 / CCAP 1560/9" /LENGTH=182 /DNA_ID=CAMNT_0047857235 /DNA_START=77 /DNA_END=625 /DNA_ORIENTATION=+